METQQTAGAESAESSKGCARHGKGYCLVKGLFAVALLGGVLAVLGCFGGKHACHKKDAPATAPGATAPAQSAPADAAAPASEETKP